APARSDILPPALGGAGLNSHAPRDGPRQHALAVRRILGGEGLGGGHGAEPYTPASGVGGGRRLGGDTNLRAGRDYQALRAPLGLDQHVAAAAYRLQLRRRAWLLGQRLA